jgi:uncharacterized protein YbjT (DUF2867 family)
MKILIVGGSGFLGSSLYEFLKSKSHEVLRTSSKSTTGEKSYIYLDFFNYDSSRIDFKSFDAVVYCSYIESAEDITTACYRKLRADGWREDSHHVFISSLTALTESNSFYAQSKRQSEKVFAQDTIIYPALIVGPGGLYQKMKDQITGKWIFPLIDNGVDLVHTVKLNDLSGFVEKILSTKSKGRFVLKDKQSISLKELFCSINPKIRLFVNIPSKPLTWLVQFADLLHIRLPINSSNIKGLKTNSKFEFHKVENLIEF